MVWVFGNAERTIVLRDDSDHVPWNPEKNEPRDINGGAGLLWRNAGSPKPEPYVAPSAPVSAPTPAPAPKKSRQKK